MRTVVPPAAAAESDGRRRTVGRTRGTAVTTVDAMPSTLDWLRARDDRALVALLRARPDLTVPAPGDLTVLAGRLNTGPSVWRAMESLNQFHIQVLQALAVLGAEKRAVSRADLRELLGATVPAAAPRMRRLDKLEGLALVRGVRADPHAVGGAGRARPLPGRARRRPARSPSRRRRPRWQDLDPTARGHPRPAGHRHPPRDDGLAVRDRPGGHRADHGRPAAPGGPDDRRTAPRGRAGAARRRAAGSDPGRSRPNDTVRKHGVRRSTAPAAARRWPPWTGSAGCWTPIGQSPPPALKSGGLGIRELRRLAKTMGTDEPTTALDVEMLAAAGMIAAADSRGRVTESWTPTADADDFLDGPDEAAWAQIAAVWLDLRRNPSRVGTRDAADKPLNALSPELSWIRGPAERRFVLNALAELPAGCGP